VWGFLAFLIAGISLLQPPNAHASSVDDPAVEEIPLCDTTEQLKFLVIEADHHGKTNAIEASGQLYGPTACAYANAVYVREADDSTFFMQSSVVTIANVSIYAIETAGRWTEIRPPIRQFAAFVTITQEAALPVTRGHDEWGSGSLAPAWSKNSCCGP
jgi:hypothetical protein